MGRCSLCQKQMKDKITNFFLIWANLVIFRGVWGGVGTNRVLLWKLTES